MKLVQQMPGGDNIKAFTRIMHRTTDDDLVGEVWRHPAPIIITQTTDQGAHTTPHNSCHTVTDTSTWLAFCSWLGDRRGQLAGWS